MTENRT